MNKTTFELKTSGKNLDQVFEKCALTLFQEIVDTENTDFVGQYDLSLSADSPEHLLEKWLNFLLFLHNKYDLVFHFFKVTIDQENNSLSATICGDKYKPDGFQQQNFSSVTTLPQITMKKRSVSVDVNINQ